MKTFKGIKPLKEIIAAAEQAGWQVDTREYDRGSDGIWLTKKQLQQPICQVRVNTVSGEFSVWHPLFEKPIATHLSSEFDDEPWYAEILTLLYRS